MPKATRHHQSPVKLAVIGAGAWGTMLACLLTRQQQDVTLWTRRPKQATQLLTTRENTRYLPGLKLPPQLKVTAKLSEAVNNVQAVFMVVPSRGLREVLEQLPEVPALISCAKGLERGSFKCLSEVIAEYQPQAKLAALSGPNLAQEIASGLPAATTIASNDQELAKAAQRWLNQAQFRVYTSQDIIGVEVGGALKNIIALAAGMSDGLKLGDNAKAGIITRGLAEIVRLGTHLGGQQQTFYGLAGLGDMIATCSSTGSRNHRAGELIAKGSSLAELEASQITAEGIPTVRAVYDYALGQNLDLPIAKEVYQVIYQTKRPEDAVAALMSREIKAEW